MYRAIMRAGWDGDTKRRVTIPSENVLFRAAITTTGDIETYFPRRVGFPAMGLDQRYLCPALRQIGVSFTSSRETPSAVAF